MSVSSVYLPATASGRAGGPLAFASRLLAAWRRHQSEQAMTALSYDMLKDIGFRSADDMADSARK